MRIFSILVLLSLILTSCSMLNGDTNTYYAHPRDYETNYDTFYLHTEDNSAFHSWWLTPKDSRGQVTVLFLHDYSRNKSYYLNETQKLVQEGYNVLTFDYLSQGYSDYSLKAGGTGESIAALTYLVDSKAVSSDKLVVYAQGEAGETALTALKEFGFKPGCIILDNPPSSLMASCFSSAAFYLQFLSFGSDHNFNNDQKSIPILVYCTEENENSFDKLDQVSQLSVRAMLSGNGSQKILHSKQYRDEMIEFINMSLGAKEITPEESLQE